MSTMLTYCLLLNRVLISVLCCKAVRVLVLVLGRAPVYCVVPFLFLFDVIMR